MLAAPNIRRAELRDAAALAMLFGDAAMLPFTTVAPHSSIAYWEKKLAEYADAACLPLVAFDVDALTGVLLMRAYPNHIRRKHCAVIDLLAVRPDHRRKGTGRALIDATIAACDHWLQMRRIEVTVETNSAALKRFYASFGFEIGRAHV